MCLRIFAFRTPKTADLSTKPAQNYLHQADSCGTRVAAAWRKARDTFGTWPADRLARPYDLRHTHATVALNAGIPVPEMAARLGHSPAMLLDTYADIVAADAARWTDRLGAAFGG